MPFLGRKGFEKAVGAPGYFGEKGFTTVERLLDPADVRIERHLGRLFRERAPRPSSRQKPLLSSPPRLVPKQDPHKIAKLVEKHIRKLLPRTVHCKFEVLSTGKPWVASYHDPIFKKAQSALEKGFGKKAVSFARVVPFLS